MAPESMAPLYHQSEGWHDSGVVQPSVSHTLWKMVSSCTVVEFGSTSMRTYCAASCWSASG